VVLVIFILPVVQAIEQAVPAGVRNIRLIEQFFPFSARELVEIPPSFFIVNMQDDCSVTELFAVIHRNPFGDFCRFIQPGVFIHNIFAGLFLFKGHHGFGQFHTCQCQPVGLEALALCGNDACLQLHLEGKRAYNHSDNQQHPHHYHQRRTGL